MFIYRSGIVGAWRIPAVATLDAEIAYLLHFAGVRFVEISGRRTSLFPNPNRLRSECLLHAQNTIAGALRFSGACNSERSHPTVGVVLCWDQRFSGWLNSSSVELSVSMIDRLQY